MLTAFQLIFSPASAWTRIANAQRGIIGVLLLFWLPWMLLATGLEGYALYAWGDVRGEFRNLTVVPLPDIEHYLIARWLSYLAVLVFGTISVRAAASGMHQRCTLTQCVTLVAYAMAPLFLGRILDCVPALNTWLCWGLGAAAMLGCMYHGVGLVIRPDITKGFGMYIILFLAMLILTGLGQFLAVMVLHKGTLV